METWAHPHDVADALAVVESTARLRHIAHLGGRTRRFSYKVGGKDCPEQEVRIELIAPDGVMWAMGPESASSLVRGLALGLCLVVTQRRHLSDTDLEASEPVAAEWLSLAQACAGPRGWGASRTAPSWLDRLYRPGGINAEGYQGRLAVGG